jgi:xanthine/CO dehydrogenase XdhC/CoxF family maturation factor
VKHWKETGELLSRAVRLSEAEKRAALATVVRIEGSSYRRPGAKFLVEEEGGTAGGVSGGCLEADVREVALQVIRSGQPKLLRYETGSDDASVLGLGLGCNGTIEILVAPATTREAVDAAREILDLLSGDEAFVVSTPLRGEGAGRPAVHGPGAPAPRAGDNLFVETLAPPPPLVVFGAGDDAMPLCSFATEAGFRVTVVDQRPAALTRERFPGAFRLVPRRPAEGMTGIPAGPRAFAVVKTHGFAQDREWVRLLLEAGVPYVGLLGPRARGARILSQVGGESGGRVFTPVGLDLGAEGPEQVAIAIVAELLAVRSSRQPWSLREKEGSIHAG